MPIIPPPGLEHWFLESPWAALAVFVVLGVISRVIGTRKDVAVLRWGGWGFSAIGGAVVALAIFVVTPRESAMQATRDMLAATVSEEGEAPSAQAVLQFLHTDIELASTDDQVWTSGNHLRDRMSEALDIASFREQSILSMQGWGQGDQAITQIRLKSRSAAGIPALTQWHLEWQRNGEQWQLRKARWITFNGQSAPKDVMNYLR